MTGVTDDFKQAENINAQACDFCPAVHINLMDGNGEVFASGSIPVQECEAFIAMIRCAVLELGKRHSAPTGRQ
jgi:hypothetical protein